MRYPDAVKADALARLRQLPPPVTLRTLEPLEDELGISALTLRSWAGQLGLVRRTGRRGRPPGPCSTPYRKAEVARSVGRPEPMEVLGFTREEERRLDAFLDRHAPGWRQEVRRLWTVWR